MLKHTETKVIETVYSVDELEKATCNKPLDQFRPKQKAMELLSQTIQANRFEILGTFDGYQVITNGYGQFKEVRTKGQLDTPKTISHKEVFNKIKGLEK